MTAVLVSREDAPPRALPGELGLTLALLLPGAAFLVLAFGAPLARLVEISFWPHEPGGLMRPGFTLANYIAFLGDPFYLGKLVLTLRIAAEVTLATLLLAWPTAYLIARTRFAGRGLLLGVVLAPLLTNFIVLVFAWIVLLGDKGAINLVLWRFFGLSEPVRLLYAEPGFVIALVHVSLPYAVVPLLESIGKIDDALEEAAASLGADSVALLRHVLLPLSAGGLAAAAFVTVSIVLSSFAFALFIGGDAVLIVPLLIWQNVTATLNWPMAAAMSLATLLLIGATLLATVRLAGALRALLRARSPS